MLIQLSEGDDRALYLQIASAVRRALMQGDITPGDRLPAGRDLAQALGVNLDTVQRAYRQLAEEGLVVSRVGRGTSIAPDVHVDRLTLTEYVDLLVTEARRLGLTGDELLRTVRAKLT